MTMNFADSGAVRPAEPSRRTLIRSMRAPLMVGTRSPGVEDDMMGRMGREGLSMAVDRARHRLGWSVLFLFGMLVVAGCSDSSTEVEEEPGPEAGDPPRLSFEVEWARAWLGRFWMGFQIDETGAIWAYDVSEREWGDGRPWGQPPEPSAFPESELEMKWSRGRRLLAYVEPAVFAEMLELARTAESGEYFRPNAACNDAGMFTYLVHRFDEEQDVWVPVVLRQDGYEMRQGQSPEAKVLGPWLRSLVAEAVHPTLHEAWIYSCASEDWESFPPRF